MLRFYSVGSVVLLLTSVLHMAIGRSFAADPPQPEVRPLGLHHIVGAQVWAFRIRPAVIAEYLGEYEPFELEQLFRIKMRQIEELYLAGTFVPPMLSSFEQAIVRVNEASALKVLNSNLTPDGVVRHFSESGASAGPVAKGRQRHSRFVPPPRVRGAKYVASPSRWMYHTQLDDVTEFIAHGEATLLDFIQQERQAPSAKRSLLSTYVRWWEKMQDCDVLLAWDTRHYRTVIETWDRFFDGKVVRMMPARPFWQNSNALVLGIHVGIPMRVELRAQCETPEDCERLIAAIQELLRDPESATKQLWETSSPTEDAFRVDLNQLCRKILDGVNFDRQGNELQMTASCTFEPAEARSLIATFMSHTDHAMRAEHTNTNLKFLAFAMESYKLRHGHLPPAVLRSRQGIPYSWRVALLPHLDQNDLFKRYRFDEPWDGPRNRLLLAEMPSVFRSPLDQGDSTNTSYFVPTGEGTLFGGTRGVANEDVPDGLENTILLLEARRDVPWTKPEDLHIQDDKPLPQLGGWRKHGCFVATGDGRPNFLSSVVEESVMRALFSRRGAEEFKSPFPPRFVFAW